MTREIRYDCAIRAFVLVLDGHPVAVAPRYLEAERLAVSNGHPTGGDGVARERRDGSSAVPPGLRPS